MSVSLFKHNQAAYDAAVSMLRETGKAAIIHPTGTGKSFIGFRLCADHPEAVICWLSPSEYIFKTQIENLKRSSGGYAPDNIRFYTYTKLMLMSADEIMAIRPDYIILDEFHRCGAEMWGQGVQDLLSACPDALLLGLSATNIRYLDNRRDMADELFDGNTASQMTLGEAIVRGILNPPLYVTALYSYQKDLEKYERRVKNARTKAVRDVAERYLKALRRALEKADGLEEIFRKHMTNRRGKYIVFCANAEHMQEMINKAPEHFSKVDGTPHIYSAYSSNPETSKAFADFKADDSDHLKLLYCIDMLNEGVHVDNISGVVLFRPTVSPIIYKQQIGRALCAGKDSGTVILDIVDNISNLYGISAIQDEMDETIQFYRYLGEERYVVNEKFRVIDEVRDCKRLFDELENTLSASWDCMYAAAKKYYEENGDLLPLQTYTTEEGYKLGQWVVTQRVNYAKKELSAYRIKKLEAIGMSWLTLHERFWEECFALAQKYYRKNGHLNVTTRQSSKLNSWIVCQRAKYQNDQLTDEQVRRLSEVGMVWEPEDTWAARYEDARRFYEANGHLDIPATYVTENGGHLGSWYRTVRSQYREGTLSEERIQMLEKIGIQWTSVKVRNWMQNYELAKAYYDEHGDLNVNANYVTPDGVKLGVWISAQRYSYQKKRLLEEQIELLEQIGMSWHRDQSRWEVGYSHAQAYCAEHGSANVPADYVTEEGFALGQWIATQRRKYKAEKLKPKQIERLERLGIEWNPFDLLWDKGYQYAKEYFDAHGNLNCSGSFVTADGFKLGSWINNQKTKYKKQALTGLQIEKLERIGIVWSVFELKWNTAYREAENYFKTYGDLLVPAPYRTDSGFFLGDWLRRQRQNQDRLSSRQIAQLDAIGMIWDQESLGARENVAQMWSQAVV